MLTILSALKECVSLTNLNNIILTSVRVTKLAFCCRVKAELVYLLIILNGHNGAEW